MNILIASRPIAPPWDSGSMNMAYALATQLAERHVVYIPVLRNFTPESKKLVARPIYTNRQFCLLQKIRLFAYLLTSPPVDVLQFFFAPNLLTATIASSLLRLRRVPSVLTLTHTCLPNRPPHVFGTHVVTYSAYHADLLRRAGIENVSQIPPGVDERTVHPGLKGDEIGRELGIPPEAPVVLYAGEYSNSATLEALITAVDFCGRESSALRFVFACRVRNRNERQRQAKIAEHIHGAGWGKQVLMLETVPQMRELIARADVCILPLRNTYGKVDLPLFLLEAMAMAKPIVVTEIPPLVELVDGATGLVVPVGNGMALAEAIQRMLTDGREYGIRGRQMIERMFTIKRVSLLYETLYMELT